MIRGAIWWAELPDPVASEPGYRRPVLIIQSNAFNRSRIHTVIAVVITANLRLADAPGNVRLAARESGLPKDSVANVSQIIPTATFRFDLSPAAWYFPPAYPVDHQEAPYVTSLSDRRRRLCHPYV